MKSKWSPRTKRPHVCRKPSYLSVLLHGGLAVGLDLRTSRIWTCGDCNKSYRPYWAEWGYESYVWKEVPSNDA